MSKTVARRLFSRALMGVPLVLGAKASGSTLPKADYSQGHMLDTAPHPSGPGLWNLIRKAMAQHDDARNQRDIRRNMMGGYDPDLAVCNSMSVQHRILRQMERDKAAYEKYSGIRATIIRGLGGNPDEY